MPLTLAIDGAQHIPAALDPLTLVAIEAALAPLPTDRPGQRLTALAELAPLLASTGSIGSHAAAHLGQAAKPVRAILFDKSQTTNWALGWHQDRTIAVRERIETAGFGPWTIKSGLHHVAPPQSLLDRMVTLRVHLDPVDPDNAPLLIAPGSHRHGRIAESDVAAMVDRCVTVACPFALAAAPKRSPNSFAPISGRMPARRTAFCWPWLWSLKRENLRT